MKNLIYTLLSGVFLLINSTFPDNYLYSGSISADGWSPGPTEILANHTVPQPVPLNITATLGDAVACPGDEIVIPVNVAGLVDVHAFNIAINYDNSVVSYINYSDVNDLIMPGFLQVYWTGSQIRIAWIDLQPLNIGSGLLMNLHFTYLGGTGAFSFSTGESLFADFAGNVIPTTFVNSSVQSQTGPVITQQPVDVVIPENSNTSFSVMATGATSYKWQVKETTGTWNDVPSATPYSGEATSTLAITGAPASFDGNLYRCVVTGNCGQSLAVTSNPALLRFCYDIDGVISYANAFFTPLDHVTVTLNPGNVIITSDAGGHYEFTCLLPGTYTIDVTCNKPWGGATDDDVTKIQDHYCNVPPPLTGIYLLAAYVDNDNFVGGMDAVMVKQRILNLLSSFPRGDWVFERPVITLTNSDVTQNILGLCVGDVDGSYIP
ncbi:MAG: cohesin domain-containing protein [Bacteroidetes bacterium]|nr:cohesin domain-containing protein [Bacteroidota bacterium]